MLDYAYSARRFPPVILLNFFGGRINEPLKQNLITITHINYWMGAVGGKLSSLNESKCKNAQEEKTVT